MCWWRRRDGARRGSVQELYAELAGAQGEGTYWPARLDVVADSGAVNSVLDGRKLIYPLRVSVGEGAAMQWMWWGLSCRRTDSSRFAQVMWDVEAQTQLYRHAGGLIAGQGRAVDAVTAGFDVSSAVIGVLGLLGMAVAPPVGAALAVTGAVKTGWDQRGLKDRLDQWREQRAGREIDITASRGDQITEIGEALVQVSRQGAVGDGGRQRPFRGRLHGGSDRSSLG